MIFRFLWGIGSLHGTNTATLTPATLAGRAAFALGHTTIDPASRCVRGPGGAAMLEPRVMQVLVALAEQAGEVVTRSDLVRRCWGVQFVGDDALNRAVAEVRRVARGAAAGSFTVETIPKTGYRLLAAPSLLEADVESAAATMPTRRALIAGGAVAFAGAAAWRWRIGHADRAAGLFAEGQREIREDMPDPTRRGVANLRRALLLAPGDAATLGLLAVALGSQAEYAASGDKARTVAECQTAARGALAINPRQPDALAALALLQPEFGDWSAAEQRLRAILAIDRGNETAAAALGVLLQGVGRTRDSAALSLDLSNRFPMAPRYRYRRSYALWNLGNLPAADRNIDAAMELWPRHPAIWFCRLWILAMTDRAATALAMVDDREAWPVMLSRAHAAKVRTTLVALVSRAPADIWAAVDTLLAAVMTGPSWAVYAIMILSRLRELDAAFEVAEGYLLRRGRLTGRLRHTAAQPSINDQRHRKTMMLFIPSSAPLRADPRFIGLCRDMGMVEYWQFSGYWPDFLGARRVA